METVVNARPAVRDEQGNFLFRKEWLKNYSVIQGPVSKVKLTVTNSPNLYTPNDGNSPRYIVNLKAVLASDLPKLKALFGQGEYVKANALNKVFLSGTVWVNEGVVPQLPMKGETVLCNIDFVFSPAEGKDVLRVTQISVAPANEATKVDIDALFEESFASAELDAFEKATK